MLFLRRQLLRSLSFAFGSSFIPGRNQPGIVAQTVTQPKVSPPPAGPPGNDPDFERRCREPVRAGCHLPVGLVRASLL